MSHHWQWWLLAIPHYLIVTLFIGSITWSAWHFGGLISVLTVIAGVVLLCTGSYPRSVQRRVRGYSRAVGGDCGGAARLSR